VIPFGNHTVTMLHYDGVTYKREVLEGCSWKSKNERSLFNGATTVSERTVCRIPSRYTCPIPGDLLILGNVIATASGEIELVRLMDMMRQNGYKAFRVESCADNSHAIQLAHYAAIGA
jgi:hypothetical protein